MSTELCILLIVAIVITPVIIVVLKSKGGHIKAKIGSEKRSLEIEYDSESTTKRIDA